jgi:hypothetical protein
MVAPEHELEKEKAAITGGLCCFQFVLGQVAARL